MADTKVGTITHYFDKIGVAVLALTGTLKVGDTIKISGRGEEFSMTVDSMQVDHQAIQEAKKDQEVGMKVTQATKEGDEVYKVS